MLTPIARPDLIVEDLGTETVIYNEAANEAHCLDATAAFVWRRCDGKRTIEQLRKELAREIGQRVGENELRDLIEMIQAKGLTETSPSAETSPSTEVSPSTETYPSTDGVTSFSRRGVLGRAVVIGTLCVTIQSIVAPTPAHAASCGSGRRPPPRTPPPMTKPPSHSDRHKNSPSHPHQHRLLHLIVKRLHKLLH